MEKYLSTVQEKVIEEDQLQKIVEGGDINVAIRARPLLDYEVEQGYFETCFARNKNFYFMEPKVDMKGTPMITPEINTVDYSYWGLDSN